MLISSINQYTQNELNVERMKTETANELNEDGKRFM